jgi:hypothetical protein
LSHHYPWWFRPSLALPKSVTRRGLGRKSNGLSLLKPGCKLTYCILAEVAPLRLTFPVTCREVSPACAILACVQCTCLTAPPDLFGRVDRAPGSGSSSGGERCGLQMGSDGSAAARRASRASRAASGPFRAGTEPPVAPPVPPCPPAALWRPASGATARGTDPSSTSSRRGPGGVGGAAAVGSCRRWGRAGRREPPYPRPGCSALTVRSCRSDTVSG